MECSISFFRRVAILLKLSVNCPETNRDPTRRDFCTFSSALIILSINTVGAHAKITSLSFNPLQSCAHATYIVCPGRVNESVEKGTRESKMKILKRCFFAQLTLSFSTAKFCFLSVTCPREETIETGRTVSLDRGQCRQRHNRITL